MTLLIFMVNLHRWCIVDEMESIIWPIFQFVLNLYIFMNIMSSFVVFCPSLVRVRWQWWSPGRCAQYFVLASSIVLTGKCWANDMYCPHPACFIRYRWCCISFSLCCTPKSSTCMARWLAFHVLSTVTNRNNLTSTTESTCCTFLFCNHLVHKNKRFHWLYAVKSKKFKRSFWTFSHSIVILCLRRHILILYPCNFLCMSV